MDSGTIVAIVGTGVTVVAAICAMIGKVISFSNDLTKMRVQLDMVLAILDSSGKTHAARRRMGKFESPFEINSSGRDMFHAHREGLQELGKKNTNLSEVSLMLLVSQKYRIELEQIAIAWEMDYQAILAMATKVALEVGPPPPVFKPE